MTKRSRNETAHKSSQFQICMMPKAINNRTLKKDIIIQDFATQKNPKKHHFQTKNFVTIICIQRGLHAMRTLLLIMLFVIGCGIAVPVAAQVKPDSKKEVIRVDTQLVGTAGRAWA